MCLNFFFSASIVLKSNESIELRNSYEMDTEIPPRKTERKKYDWSGFHCIVK